MPKLPDLSLDNAAVVIPEGIYRIEKPVTIRSKNLRIIGEGNVVIRGTAKAGWDGKAYHSTAPADGFYIGNRKYTMARYPKQTDPNAPFGGYAADCILPEKTREWKNPKGGYIHALHKHLWGGFSYRIEGKRDDGTLILSGGWQNNRQMGMHDEYRYAENIREEMTEPGEWYYDEDSGEIRAILCPGDSPEDAEAVVSEGLFILDGCENVTFENITFERTSRTFMKTKEPLLRSDWTIYRGGAVVFRDSSNCGIDRCRFYDIGSNGVFADGNCSEISVVRSRFKDIGASGVCFVGKPDSVRSPLFEYGETHALDELDLTPGPKSDNYPKNCLVDDCLIEHVGTAEKQATGVEISMAYGITVRNCTICHTSRAGINISEGTFGGHVIEGCDVFDTVRETGDHGSFNSWGRDRYWHLRDSDGIELGKYAGLDMLADNRIIGNRFRCDHGWDIDLDDGSSRYIIENNLCLCGGIKLREGFFRTVRHNICVNNTLHLHAWYHDSGDVAEENVLFAPYSTYSLPPVWGESINRNILYDPESNESVPAVKLSSLSGQDADSVEMNLKFVNPGKGDYRVEGLSCYEDFPTEFGVRYPPLRSVSPQPELPVIRTDLSAEKEASEKIRIKALGVTVRNIESDGEMSFYGTPGHDGAVVLSVEEESAAESAGLKEDDVIIAVGSGDIKSAADLLNVEDFGVITILRKQRRIILESRHKK